MPVALPQCLLHNVAPQVHQRRPVAAVRRCPKVAFQHALRRSLPALQAVSDVDNISIDELSLDDPYQRVGDVCKEHDLKFAMPAQLLPQIESFLDAVQALPVLDDDFKVVGVVARKDVEEAQRDGTYNTTTVVEVMSAPVTVRARAHIGEAASVMLSKKIHSVPVVDAEGRLMGILSRSDIFKSQLTERADQLKALTVEMPTPQANVAAAAAATSAAVAAVSNAAASAPSSPSTTAQPQSVTWTIKYLYDGDCSICRSLKALLDRQDGGKGRIEFVNIASSKFDPDENGGISYEEAMETIHAIRANGEILTGPPALLALYEAVGLGWVAKLAALPVFAAITETLYAVISKYRLPMGGAADALLAAHRMKQVDAGINHCTDDEEECTAPEW